MHNETLRRIVTRAAAGLVIAVPLAQIIPAHAAAKTDAFDASRIDTFAGAFLAGRVADADNDDTSAINFYRRALDFQPDNLEVKERLMVTLFMQGDFDHGVALAEEIKDDPAVDRITAIARGLQAIRAQKYDKARKIFAYQGDNDLDRLMDGLLKAWADFGGGQKKEAIAAVKGLNGPQWFGIFRSYTIGLMAQASGQIDKARTAYQQAITDMVGGATAPDTYMRAVIALAEMEATAGNRKAALDAVATGEKFSPGYPPLDAVRQAIENGSVQERPVKTAAQGAATVMFAIGSALNRKGAEEVVSLYLNFSEALDPDNPATRVMLGGIAESLGRPEAAIKIYDGIPKNSPMRRLSDLQRGLDLSEIGKKDEAERQLRELIAEDPSDMRSYLALGSVLSNAKDYKAMADIYDKAVAKLGGIAGAPDWNIYFQRGIAYERLKDWSKAEPNFKKALDLQPDQPQVLNYLGYSWIDRNMHLEEGLKMVKKAVSLRPNDGYIVDSLGWAYYKLGKFEQGRGRVGTRRGAETGRCDDQRPSRRCLLAGGSQDRGHLPVEPGTDIQARRRPDPPDQGEDQERPARPGERPPGQVEAEMKDGAPPKSKPADPASDKKSELMVPALVRQARLGAAGYRPSADREGGSRLTGRGASHVARIIEIEPAGRPQRSFSGHCRHRARARQDQSRPPRRRPARRRLSRTAEPRDLRKCRRHGPCPASRPRRPFRLRLLCGGPAGRGNEPGREGT